MESNNSFMENGFICIPPSDTGEASSLTLNGITYVNTSGTVLGVQEITDDDQLPDVLTRGVSPSKWFTRAILTMRDGRQFFQPIWMMSQYFELGLWFYGIQLCTNSRYKRSHICQLEMRKVKLNTHEDITLVVPEGITAKLFAMPGQMPDLPPNYLRLTMESDKPRLVQVQITLKNGTVICNAISVKRYAEFHLEDVLEIQTHDPYNWQFNQLVGTSDDIKTVELRVIKPV